MKPRTLIWLAMIGVFVAFMYQTFTSADMLPFNCSEKKDQVVHGRLLYQEGNCTSCHQLYGLGGYLGPELTTVMSQQGKGELYVRAVLEHGLGRMPKYGFSAEEIDALVAFFVYVDSTAITYRGQKNIASGGGLLIR